MIRWRVLYQLMRADYLERVRRYAFVVTLGLTAYFAYLEMPPNHARYVTLRIGSYRGIYNSEWVGCQVALMTAAFLSLAGFYLVRSAIERDRVSGVGQILATTPLAKWQYTLGKWASNMAVLTTLVATMSVCAIGMQLLRGEDRAINPVAIAVPLVLVTLPAMALTAGVAVLFEALPMTAGGFGNVIFFFIWGFVFAGPDLGSSLRYHGIGSAVGLSAVVPEMVRSVSSHFAIPSDSLRFSLGFNFQKAAGVFDLQTFRWQGMTWTAELLAGRLAWTLIGMALALAAAIPFDRFDSSRVVKLARPSRLPERRDEEPSPPQGAATAGLPGIPDLALARRRESFLPMLLAEIRLALLDMPRPWFVVAAALALAGWLVPLPVARGWILPFAWIWPLLVWSALGARESRHGTAALVFSSPRPLVRQLPALWLAGVAVAVALGAGVGVRLVATGMAGAALAWGVAALFIPALALAAGVWTGGGKLFEVLYLLVWYVGPMNRTPFLDFIGASGVVSVDTTAGFAIATLILLACAVLGRWRALEGRA